MDTPKPDLESSFEYEGETIIVKWYELDAQIPDLPWQQIYVIGDIDGKAPIVHYETGDKDNLPGGKVESGETVEETIKREIHEEIYCEVDSWVPLGYQVLIEPSGKTSYQLRVCAKLHKIGEFKNDPGGSVIGYSLVPLDKLNSYIQYGEVGDRMIELAKKKLETLN